MTTPHQPLPQPPFSWQPPSWLVMGMILIVILLCGLVAPVAAALTTFTAISALTHHLRPRCGPVLALRLAVTSTLLLLLTGAVASVLGLSALLDDQAGIRAVAQKMTEALVMMRHSLPAELSEWIPKSADAAFDIAQSWLEDNIATITLWGKTMMTLIFQVIAGLFVGAMIAIQYVAQWDAPPQERVGNRGWTVLVLGLLLHVGRFAAAFKQVVFAQCNIAFINAIVTGLFLAVAMPLLGYHLPLTKTLIVLTFVFGLIPILGNILSNTVIFLVALSVSPWAAFLSLGFLVLIHKAEYFLNAWIIGTKIQVKSYEVVASMIVCEALFGLYGLISAPILYAYIKSEYTLSKQPPSPIHHPTLPL